MAADKQNAIAIFYDEYRSSIPFGSTDEQDVSEAVADAIEAVMVYVEGEVKRDLSVPLPARSVRTEPSS